jgi:hypothetical protein
MYLLFFYRAERMDLDGGVIHNEGRLKGWALKSRVEVCNTDHIIMFKVILKLFAATFSQFFLQKRLYQYRQFG